MSLDGDDIPSENGNAFPSENRNRKSRRYSKDRARRSNLIAEETDSLTKSSDTRLRVDEDRERMTLNPGKSLKSSAKDLPKYYRSTFCTPGVFCAGLRHGLFTRQNRFGISGILVIARPRHLPS